MTCVAGVADGTTVWMAGDSAGVSGWSLTVRADEKVFARGPFLMGFTTSFRMGQLLRYSLSVPQQPEGQDVDEFMCTSFVEAVRTCLKAGGYRVESDYQVARTADGYDAVGCGGDIAVGALYAARDAEPEKRLVTAMEAAERHSAGVRGPFTVRSLR